MLVWDCSLHPPSQYCSPLFETAVAENINRLSSHCIKKKSIQRGEK
ncbi:hypothetical protein [Bartonella henselae]|nr:hypothetical protein [Bartonella henselae]